MALLIGVPGTVGHSQTGSQGLMDVMVFREVRDVKASKYVREVIDVRDYWDVRDELYVRDLGAIMSLREIMDVRFVRDIKEVMDVWNARYI